LKKLFTTTEYKKRNQRHADLSFFVRNKRKKKYYSAPILPVNKIHDYEESLKKDFPGYEIVIPPEEFSFIDNTESVVIFINQIMVCYENRKKVFVKLLRVQKITYDAIIVLLSIMVKFREAGIDFNGDKPLGHSPRELLDKSGFFSELFTRKFVKSEIYEFTHSDNLICTHGDKNVASDLSTQLTKTASNYLTDYKVSKAQGVQRLMIELMQNTNNHASETPGEKHWWLSMSRNDKNKTIYFSFVDFGVGILSSLEKKPDDNSFKSYYKKLVNLFGIENQHKHLKEIFSGALYAETVTGEHFRGKGLPGIGAVVKRGQISNLHIITNRVKGSVKDNVYEKLSCNFSGTFYHWELKTECLSKYGKDSIQNS